MTAGHFWKGLFAVPKLTDAQKVLLEKNIREQVYREGMQLLRENESQLFTMNALADRIGVSKGTLYNYFQDKSAVIVYLNERMTREVFSELCKALAHAADYKEGLRLAFRTFSRTMAEHRFLHAAMLIIRYEEMANKKPLELPAAAEKYIMPYMADFFQRGIAAGVFKAMPVEYLTGFMAAAMHGLSMVADCRTGEDKGADAVRNMAMEELLIAALCR